MFCQVAAGEGGCWFLVSLGQRGGSNELHLLRELLFLLFPVFVHILLQGEWSAGPRSAVALSSILPRPRLHVTPHKAAGVWHKSLIANIYR